jgi:hypothetical protein
MRLVQGSQNVLLLESRPPLLENSCIPSGWPTCYTSDLLGQIHPEPKNCAHLLAWHTSGAVQASIPQIAHSFVFFRIIFGALFFRHFDCCALFCAGLGLFSEVPWFLQTARFN